MKRILSLGIMLAFVLSAGNVFAFGPGNLTGNSKANQVINTVGSTVALDQMNKKLAEKSASCICNTKTGEITGCDLGSIKKVIDGNKVAVKAAFNSSFRISAKSQRACYDTLRDKIPASSDFWDWYYSKYNGPEVKIWGEK